MNIKAISLLLMAAAALPAAATDYLDRTGWSWSTSSELPSGYDYDVSGLAGICDGDASTCWHSNYLAQSGTPERSNPHWIMIDRGSDSKPFYGLSYLTRQSTLNQCCTEYMIYLSDSDMSSAPATSVEDIISALGTPDYRNSLSPTSEEIVINFDKASTARYILFVNVSSNASSSAACAEMNLVAGAGAPAGTFNALRIYPADGSDVHYIAIDGANLSFSLVNGRARFGNSQITVEYDPAEFARVEFDNYEFTDSLYVGPKVDINKITDAIEEVEAVGGDAPETLVSFTREGTTLTVNGTEPGSAVRLVGIAGAVVAATEADAFGSATLSLSGLGHGVYLLWTNKKTLKLRL